MKYIIKGKMPFPLYMLAIDEAYPATIEDAQAIQDSFFIEAERLIEIEAKSFSLEKWRAFGWQIHSFE